MSGASATGRPAVELRFFGPLTDLVGADRERVELALPASTEALREELLRRYPALEGERFSLAADARMLAPGQTLSAATEISLLPAFAGG